MPPAMPHSLDQPSITEPLRRVSKPARYTGGEWGSIHKPWEEASVRICLAYPNTYESSVLRPAVVVDGVLVRHAKAVFTQDAGFVDFLDGNACALPCEMAPVGVTTIMVVVGIHATEVIDCGETAGRENCGQK